MLAVKVSLPLSEQLANVIRKSIIEGEFKAGEKISANKIAKLLNVSETPVKEAFKILQAEGLLQTKPRSGTYISDFALTSIQNMAIVRSALEGAAVNIATRVASDEELEALSSILDGADNAIQSNNLEELVRINTAFHRKIREIAHNQYLYMLLEQILSFDLSVREKALSDIETRKCGSFEHRKIVDLMKVRDSEAAEKAMIEHIRHTARKAVNKN